MINRLSDHTLESLEHLVRDVGEPAYRAKQVWEWMHRHGVFEPARMRNLPVKLRERLTEMHATSHSAVEDVSRSGDGTEKLLFRLADGKLVESVLILAPDRATVCLSSQVGCAVGCRFCASGMDGGKRNLARGEILEQFMHVRRRAELVDRKLTNIVVMGMGEPMFNYDNVISALDTINDPSGAGFGARRITVSTVGIRGGVAKFTSEKKQYTLAFSLHAPNDTLRRQIVPLEAAMSVAEIRDAATRHLAETGREATFEYVLLGGVNDGRREAEELGDLLRSVQGSVNLIPYNPVPELPYRRPSDIVIDDFAERLRRAGVKVSVRRRKGSDIDAACGQLAMRQSRG